MRFGLTNAPSTPIRLIYNVLEKYMKKYVVYMDEYYNLFEDFT